ncbi:3-oxoacyl-ACP synthase [Streptomyces sp. NPDC059467]|uniref:3-oxoacyl-ACP synthase n=1 Tax=Streptomyces sp. NPDC059467 TaxID=3346844 RepID=UPI00368772AC
MTPDEVWIAPAEWLPPAAEKTADALAAGRVTAEEADAMGYEQLPVSPDLSAPQMAVRAARRALSRAGVPAADLATVLHAWTYYQGHDFWSPAHYVAAETGAGDAIPTGVQQMCNGAAAALRTALLQLAAHPGAPVLVTTADRFAPPGFDRWGGDYGVWYGDGATAAVVGAGGDRVPEGSLALRALHTRAAPELESAHRDVAAFHEAPHLRDAAVNVRRTKKAYFTGRGKSAFLDRLRRETTAVLAAALAEAGIGPGGPGLSAVLLPRLGRATARDVYGPAVAEVTDAPTADLGERTGHLGAGDLLSNLAALAADTGPHRLERGRYAAVLSAGAGFTWSAAVVQRT